jgi:hypothetical protein
MNTVPLEQLNFESFAGLAKTRFRVWIDAQDSIDLELCEVTPRRVSSTGGVRSLTYEHFALEFLGPADRLLPQRMYWFESAAIGRFELFIVPVGRDQTGTRYQATFNRLVKPG